MRDKYQRGQALILLALAFVGLAAFVGLTVDAGILFTNIGRLRRATDSAALAAANQFREGLALTQLEQSADEFLELNGLDSATAQIFVCEEPINPGGPYSGYHDASMCGPDPKKEVRVVADLPVNFAFLPIIGFDSVTITADAISETASIDLVLAVDLSISMAYDLCFNGVNDDPGDDGVIDDCALTENKVGANSESDPDLCNPTNSCQPMEDVRAAAAFLTNRMYFPYDRMALVTYDYQANNQIDLINGDNWAAVTGQINAMQVAPLPNPAVNCPAFPPDPSGCTSTNTAGGLRNSNNLLATEGRQEAVWIIILLSDGAANAAFDDFNVEICPNTTWAQPFCRDFDPATRHVDTDSDYDTDDRARDMSDLAGCLPPPNVPAGCPIGGGNGAVIFTVGLGDAVINNQQCDDSVYTVAECTTSETLGEELLRYVAAVGDDGDPGSDPCSSTGVGADCGNYYFSPTGNGLLRVFQAIAGRIFTRLNH